MRVLLAGATGAIGRPLLARLLAAGHEVVGTTRSERGAAAIRSAGAQAAVLDAFDAGAVHAAVAAARPEVVIHQLTALPAAIDPRRYREALAGTNRLREETVPVFVAAAREAGVRRFIAQSVSFATAPAGPWVLDEDAPLMTDVPGGPARAVAALERAVTGTPGIEGVVLRYGFLYGAGTSYAPDGAIPARIRRRGFPVVGSGEGRFSFVWVEDAAAATVLALDRGGPGVLNVVDDDPAPMREWLPELARLLRAPRPVRIPAWLARIAAGEVAVHWGTAMRGASNARAREGLGWAPRHPSWREGFRATVVSPRERPRAPAAG